jgi:pimeloyl-ACP methyl ester carboxylesterase
VTLAYERLGSGPPLVLLHGVGHHRQAWAAVTDLLAPHRELFLIDLPGHGESPPLITDGRPAMPAMLDAVLGLLDELGLHRPHFAGNSLGARLSLDAGVGGRAATVTALSPVGFFRGRGDFVYARSVFRVMQAAGRWLRPVAGRLAAKPAGRAVLVSTIVNRPGQLTAEQAVGNLQAFLRATDALDAVLASTDNFTGDIPADVPVTIGWGARDRLLPRRQALLAKRLLPDARFVLLPDCGHVPMTDDPQLVADVLLTGSARALR